MFTYSLYKRLGHTVPKLIIEVEDYQNVIDTLIYNLQQDGLNKTQAVMLVEYGVPVKWTNGTFITATEQGKDIVFESEDNMLSYLLVKEDTTKY